MKHRKTLCLLDLVSYAMLFCKYVLQVANPDARRCELAPDSHHNRASEHLHDRPIKKHSISTHACVMLRLHCNGSGQRPADVQEGGLKRSFANLGAPDITAAQAAARRPHIKAENAANSSSEAALSLQSSTEPSRNAQPADPLLMADLPIAG